MGRYLILFIFLGVLFTAKSQEAIPESDPLQTQAILVFPAPTSAQLNSLKIEFAKYPQILSAVYVFQNHNCLLINLANSNTNFTYYRELIKTMSSIINYTDIKIKTPSAYTVISNDVGDVNTSFVVK